MGSVFEQIGGAAAVSAVVDDFYARVVADPTLRGFFLNTDITKLSGHQRAFLAMALGGPSSYVGRSLSEAHADLGITDDNFDSVVGHLLASLVTHEAPAGALGKVSSAVAGLRSEIVNTG